MLKEDGLTDKEIIKINIDKRKNKDLNNSRARVGPSQILGQLRATLNRKDINYEEASAVGRRM